MTLAQVSIRLMRGDNEAAMSFVHAMPDAVRLDFERLMIPLRDLAYHQMLIDPEAFMRLKVPDDIDPLPISTFMELIEAAIAEDVERLKALVGQCDILSSCTLYGSISRIMQACQNYPKVYGAPLTGGKRSELDQRQLF